VCLVLIGCTRNEPSGPTPNPDPDGVPTGPPHGSITLTSGSARISLTGELEAEESFEGVSAPAIYRSLPGTVTVTWDGGGLVIAGPLHLGFQETTVGLRLQSTLDVDGDPVRMASSAGECVITVDEADDRSFSGSFACQRLVVEDATVTASGSFEASG
jgi:hypothetical protein